MYTNFLFNLNSSKTSGKDYLHSHGISPFLNTADWIRG